MDQVKGKEGSRERKNDPGKLEKTGIKTMKKK